MMRQYELTERVLKYNPKCDEGLLNRAYVYAMKAHGNQKRRNGDPYFSHPLEVAAILTDLKLDDATIATALLHDVIEDTTVTKADIDKYFGGEIGSLVEGLTNIKKLDLASKRAEQAENFRKLLIAISSDVRVLLVKLADRLHNMRTLEHNSPESQKRNAQETLEIYAPLAGRMGMQTVREELEDLAFRFANPEAYQTVTQKLDELHKKNAGFIDEISAALKVKFAAAGIESEISGRAKRAYSIWKKMENRQIALEQLSDIYGFRVIIDSVDTCYRALGVVHGGWRAVPGRFKDYISTPKQNNYQSIHTTFVGPRNQRVEVQMRTRDMHAVAEYGIAAHALYKDRLGTGAPSTPVIQGVAASTPARDNPYLWLRRMVESVLDGAHGEEFLEHTKLELFHDQVFCFTPQGSIIALPRGATPIDFAYAVHTGLGNTCVGTLINGRQMPLTTNLRNGDEVMILTAKGHVPPAAWEQIAATGRARAAIRRASRDATKRQYVELGRRLLESAAERLGLAYGDERLKKALPRLGQRSVEDVHVAIGRNEMAPNAVLRSMFPEATITEPSATSRPANRHVRQAAATADEGWFNLSKVMSLKFRWPGSSAAQPVSPANGEDRATAAIPIRGTKSDVPISWDVGGAVPGDRIVGVLTEGEGIKIYQIHSPNLAAVEHQKWIDVTWDINAERPERFPARIKVTVLNKPGTLAQVAQVIGEADGNIDALRMTNRAVDFTDMLIDLEVWDLTHLNEIIAGLKSKPAVSKVERLFV